MSKWIVLTLCIGIFAASMWSVFRPTINNLVEAYNAVPQPPPKPPSADKLFSLINEWRKSQGLTPYIKDNRLCAIAIDRADDKILDNHVGFMRKYDTAQYPYVMQENLVSVEKEPIMLKGWLNSPPHRAALEKPYLYSCVACDKQCVQIFSSFEKPI